MSRTLNELLTASFGIKSRLYEHTVNVKTALPVTRIIDNNPNRTGVLIVNPSVHNVYVTSKTDATAGMGIPVMLGGGSLQFIWHIDFDLVGWSWFAYSDVADVDINIFEEILL